MFKGFKHTITCSKCGETREIFDTADEAENYINKHKSKCCNDKYEYIGLQPYTENILKVPFILKQEKTEDQHINTQSIIIEESQPIEDKKEVVETNEELVQSGPRGVTNAQMIPAIKKYISSGESNKIITLKETYPKVFQDSLKYLGQKIKAEVDKIVGI